jgi:hypothetical protein
MGMNKVPYMFFYGFQNYKLWKILWWKLSIWLQHSHKGGNLSQQVCYWTWCCSEQHNSSWGIKVANSSRWTWSKDRDTLLRSSIVWQWWQHNSSWGIKVHQLSKIYALTCHLRMSDAYRRKDMQIYTNMNMWDPLINFPACITYEQNQNATGVKCLSVD